MSEIKIVNATTGEEIVREMNEQELADFEASRKLGLAQAKEAQAREAALEEKLAALGLTRDDLKALLS